MTSPRSSIILITISIVFIELKRALATSHRRRIYLTPISRCSLCIRDHFIKSKLIGHKPRAPLLWLLLCSPFRGCRYVQPSSCLSVQYRDHNLLSCTPWSARYHEPESKDSLRRCYSSWYARLTYQSHCNLGMDTSNAGDVTAIRNSRPPPPNIFNSVPIRANIHSLIILGSVLSYCITIFAAILIDHAEIPPENASWTG